ncbi:hypothetical protein ACFL0W_04050 [Nanoarchaeota archaeon]
MSDDHAQKSLDLLLEKPIDFEAIRDSGFKAIADRISYNFFRVGIETYGDLADAYHNQLETIQFEKDHPELLLSNVKSGQDSSSYAVFCREREQEKRDEQRSTYPVIEQGGREGYSLFLKHPGFIGDKAISVLLDHLEEVGYKFTTDFAHYAASKKAESDSIKESDPSVLLDKPIDYNALSELGEQKGNRQSAGRLQKALSSAGCETYSDLARRFFNDKGIPPKYRSDELFSSNYKGSCHRTINRMKGVSDKSASLLMTHLDQIGFKFTYDYLEKAVLRSNS